MPTRAGYNCSRPAPSMLHTGAEVPLSLSLIMEVNIVVMGTESVGKSALTVRLLTRRFIGEYGDMESIYSHSFPVEGREQTVNIWDSPYSQDGCVQTPLFRRQLQWAHAFVLVYSICDRASFTAVCRWLHALGSSRGAPTSDPLRPPPAVLIVGNKADLEHRRTVAGEEGRQLARRCGGGCLFREVSAAESYPGVRAVFQELLATLRPAVRRPAGIKGIVKSVSSVFSRRRTGSVEGP